MVGSTPVHALRQRQEFLAGVTEIARLCNWTEEDLRGLQDHVWEELVRTDNAMFYIFEKTQNRDAAYLVWNSRMEDLRRWLSLVTGIKINYV